MRASLPTISGASMGRSASISAPSRPRRSRFRSSAKSRPCCAWSGSRGARRRDDRGIMKFGEIPVAEAAGAILAHSIKLAGRALRKGRVLGKEDVAALAESGLTTVVAARLDADELGEDTAATALAHA